MSLSQLRASGLLLVACLFTLGCPNGENLYVPPQATAAPGGSNVFIYVAEARNAAVGTNGGAVSAYRLGADGLLQGGPPLSTVTLVNPRRLAVHPALPVLYVATRSQIVGFDISNGSLRSLCGDDRLLSPPCATNPRGNNSLFDIAVGADEDGTFTLYAAETGQAGSTSNRSRLAAYPLGDNGELPGFAGSQGIGNDVVQFEALAVSSTFVWGADTAVQRMYRFLRESDGSLPAEAPTPTPINFPTPTPTPTPNEDGPTPTPTAEPTPGPDFFLLNFPGRVEVREYPNPEPNGDLGMLYAVEEGAQRLGAWPIDEFYDLPNIPASESPVRGFYQSIVIKPDQTRIYGALFQDGTVASYRLNENGGIIASSEAITLPNPASYPTGLGYLEFTPTGNAPSKTVLVSQGGLDRVDGFRVREDGSLDEKPYTSTVPRTGTFPSDIAIKVLP
ncbi:MAG: hypothetical protein P8R42_11860 [Candidatus Binatia bacterium]|nr:hypothetical protein [Candidatus Binatia bacterium]